MMDKQIGDFLVTVSTPYPYWVSIGIVDGNELRFSYTELEDIIYALQSAQSHISAYSSRRSGS